MKVERATIQKKFIIEFLKRTKSHPTAHNIYKNIKRKLPSISFGTVYRILNQLKQRGEIQEILIKEKAHFDGQNFSHAHFICQKCKKIFDLDDFCKECPIIKNKKTKVGKINNYQIYLYGYCKKCQK